MVVMGRSFKKMVVMGRSFTEETDTRAEGTELSSSRETGDCCVLRPRTSILPLLDLLKTPEKSPFFGFFTSREVSTSPEGRSALGSLTNKRRGAENDDDGVTYGGTIPGADTTLSLHDYGKGNNLLVDPNGGAPITGYQKMSEKRPSSYLSIRLVARQAHGSADAAHSGRRASSEPSGERGVAALHLHVRGRHAHVPGRKVTAWTGVKSMV